ncbi:MAG: hypothetical protein IT376_21250 [Polyangiaceae bacterium]|nr:hypothetical protein [Polyangiaceae bacterium]
MKNPLPRILVGGSAALAGWVFTGHASAQTDVDPPPPNVLLLVDSSGSMEYKSGSDSTPVCTPGVAGSEKSRWVELLEVLTGSIKDYSCHALPRAGGRFQDEYVTYGLSGAAPPDYRYPVPYHRPLSGSTGCGPGAGSLPAAVTGSVFDFPAASFKAWAWNYTGAFPSAGAECTGTWFNMQGSSAQWADGLIDTYSTRVRFGLMTFDTHTDASVGYASASSPNYSAGSRGTWSYFVGASATGRPVGCTDPAQAMEVGGRNAGAPPWEGRMVTFGDPSEAPNASGRNDEVQRVLLQSRPYGATPIAGMLDDARSYLFDDTATDPRGTWAVSPRSDPKVQGGCRENFIILLSDGQPNLDLRPYCEGASVDGGTVDECPYEKPEDTALDLATQTSGAVKTFVVGFALTNITLPGPTTVDCTTLTQADLEQPTGLCAQHPNESKLQACCTLNRIAYNGGTTRAHFANDLPGLRAALNAILAQISSTTTSRTVPVFGAAGGVRDPFGGSFRFLSSFQPNKFSVWNGALERQRFICVTDNSTSPPTVNPELQPVDPTAGDDFAANLDSGSGAARRFFSVHATTASSATIRPLVSADPDGLGVRVGTPYNASASTFVTATPATALGVTAGTCGLATDAACRSRIMQWLVGLSNGTSYHRCAVPGATDCNLLGGIFHSTPRIVGTPNEFLRDESYARFAANPTIAAANAPKGRPMVLYTSTTDGFVHAFRVAPRPGDTDKVDSLENNELWAFLPPAVLPRLQSMYSGGDTSAPAHTVLLDGAPVTRDVVARSLGGAYGGLTTYAFDRDTPAARTGTNLWRTALVQGFGRSLPGYFALDVTDPVAGPRLLWQLTTDSGTQPLFGGGGSTPLITTLFLKPTPTSDPLEVAVAVLPGGFASPVGGDCDGDGQPGMARAASSTATVDSAFAARASVRCYDPTTIGRARALTIVRLDTGEIVRTFRRNAADAPLLDPDVVISGATKAPLDSPITGQPVAFPAETGAIADRIFVGDADGGVWRVDVSSPDPDDWTMKLFFDAYSGAAYDAGQPVNTPPILSVDDTGRITVAFSTGDQEDLSATTGTNYVWSLTETVAGVAYKSKANWYESFSSGMRVSGTMSLFNGVLYFSTYAPPTSGDACSAGSARIYGLHYVIPETAGTPGDGGQPRFPDGTNLVAYIDDSNALLSGATIFGVGIAQLPSCNEVDTSFSDAFLGYGAHTSLTNVNPGEFRLVMHGGASGGTQVAGGATRVLEVTLPPPPSVSRQSSWAALVE